jgi:hypothetical protein
MSKKYTVRIAIDPPGDVPPGGSVGNFAYSLSLVNVNANDQITWTCDYPFAVSFKEGTPIDQMEVFGSPQGKRFSTHSYKVRAVRGHFHYAVAVWNGSRVFIDASCPHVRVN